MFKKAQVTVFVVIGIILLATVGIFLFVFQSFDNPGELEGFDSQTSRAGKITDSCLGSSVNNALFDFFEYGFDKHYAPTALDYVYYESTGHLTPPIVHNGTAYYFVKDQTRMISSYETMQDNFEAVITQYFNNCIQESDIDNFSASYGQPDVEVNVQKRTTVNLNFPVTLEDNDDAQVIEEFSHVLEYDIKTKFDWFTNYVTQHQQDYVGVGSLSVYAFDNNYTYHLVRLNNDDILYRVFLDKHMNRDVILQFIMSY